MIYITPAEFEDKMNEILDGVIPETIIEAVEVVTEVLCDNGYGEGAAVFSACVKDWFDTYVNQDEIARALLLAGLKENKDEESTEVNNNTLSKV